MVHDYSEATGAAIDSEVRSIVTKAMERVLAILREKSEVLKLSAQRLLEKETLDEKDLLELVGPPAGPPLRVAAE
jgi:cell division protease FtsH